MHYLFSAPVQVALGNRESPYCISDLPICMQADKPEKQAKAVPTDLKSLTVRQYLEATVVAVLLKGLQEVRHTAACTCCCHARTVPRWSLLR